MTEAQVDKLFDLLSKSTPGTRENIKTFYLDRIGKSIIGYCIRHFQKEKNADVRCDYLRFTIQFARTENQVIEFAKNALTDKSVKVRRKALSIFAFSLRPDLLDLLKSLRGKLKGNEEDIENAMKAIKSQNHNLFYPMYDVWTVTVADEQRHLNKEQFAEDVKLYIEKYAKEAVPELTTILGSVYN